MKPFNVTIDVKKYFLDQQKVIKRLGVAKTRIFKRAGSTVRKIARNSIRRRKKPAPPGRPPHSHVKSGGFGLKSILFALPPGNDRVVIGPLGGRGSPVPAVMEFGGTTKVSPDFKGYVRHKKSRRRLHGAAAQRALKAGSAEQVGTNKTRARVRKRPFMNPALQTFSTEYPKLWKDAIK